MVRTRRRRVLIATAVVALACNQGLEPRAACPPSFVGICGEVRLVGAVPESTDLVVIVAFEQFPIDTLELLNFRPPLPFPFRVPLGDSIAPYQLGLAAGRYEWVLAVWKKQGPISLATANALLREAGFYRDPADPSRPGVVTVNGATDGIDFTVDFDNMHPVSYWFPAAPAARP
jgi:hypothetical protein